jgi:hypothetical protein
MTEHVLQRLDIRPAGIADDAAVWRSWCSLKS